MLATQAGVVMAALAAPALAPLIAPAHGLPAEAVGYFSALLFASAFLASTLAGPLIARYGPMRVSQATVLIAAAALVALGAGVPALGALAAVALGAAYAPGNPASSHLLGRLASPARRGLIFSIKQTAVPIGGALAGVGLTGLAAAFDWRAALWLAALALLALALVSQPWRAGLDADRRPGARLSVHPFALPRAIAAIPGLRATAVLAGSFAAVQFAFAAIFVAYLTQAIGLGVATAGAALSLAMGISIGLRIALGFAADAFGGARVLASQAVLMLAAALACAAAGPDRAWLALTAGVILGATAFGWNGVFLAEVARIAPRAEVARATSACMACVFLGGAVGPALFSALVGGGTGFAGAFVLLAGFAALGLAACLMATRTRPRTP